MADRPNFIERLKVNLFKNTERFAGSGEPLAGGKPQFSNGKVTLHTDLPAGTYSIGAWQYSDTGNISLKFDEIVELNEPSSRIEEPVDYLERAHPAKRNVSDDFS